ncbi:MAG TPA: hypothetical protein QF695_09750, partial [Arenicellales bacterium]|nr:hypothetical protein [Arenicellales bacterium]
MRRHLVTFLKIIVVAVLLSAIYFAIDWHDSYTIISSEDGHQETIYGKIVGPWDSNPVLFHADGASAPKSLRLTNADGQSSVNLSPGILTYFSNLDVPLFLLGAAAFFIFVVIINSRWWWLM